MRAGDIGVFEEDGIAADGAQGFDGQYASASFIGSHGDILYGDGVALHHRGGPGTTIPA